MKIVESITIGPYTVLVFESRLPLTKWRAIVVDGVRYDTLPVMDAGDDLLAVTGSYDMAGKVATFV